MSALWGLFSTFVPISLVTVGGGQATVAEIQRQVVDTHHWLTQAQFLNAFAITRMAPGPGSLLVTLIGWQVAGFWGAVVATAAMFGPTAILLFTIAYFWRRQRGANWQLALESGLRPIAAGMMAAAVYVLMSTLEGGWMAQAIALISTGLVMFTRVNALLLVLGGGVALILCQMSGLA
ncbi:MAG TPA: chromate transporter [Bordetella sp.]